MTTLSMTNPQSRLNALKGALFGAVMCVGLAANAQESVRTPAQSDPQAMAALKIKINQTVTQYLKAAQSELYALPAEQLMAQFKDLPANAQAALHLLKAEHTQLIDILERNAQCVEQATELAQLSTCAEDFATTTGPRTRVLEFEIDIGKLLHTAYASESVLKNFSEKLSAAQSQSPGLGAQLQAIEAETYWSEFGYQAQQTALALFAQQVRNANVLGERERSDFDSLVAQDHAVLAGFAKAARQQYECAAANPISQCISAHGQAMVLLNTDHQKADSQFSASMRQKLTPLIQPGQVVSLRMYQRMQHGQ